MDSLLKATLVTILIGGLVSFMFVKKNKISGMPLILLIMVSILLGFIVIWIQLGII